jgi:uncharacterized protein (DUF488 family)
MMEKIKVASIGFTKTTAQRFFERLKTAGVKKVLDVRLHNTSQLAGFAKAGDWSEYEKRFLNLMNERYIEDKLRPEQLEGACLLCSEATPHHCHRRLVIEYLNDKWNGKLEMRHL